MNKVVVFTILSINFIVSCYNDSASNELPQLAPYELSELADAFEKYNLSERETIRSLFTKSYYDAKCGKFQTTIQPIYYWPGDTVKLRCVRCIDNQNGQNGSAKNWAVFQTNIPESISNLEGTLSADKWGNERWLILNKFNAEQMRDNFTMKSYLPGNGTETRKISVDNRIPRPLMSFSQRDGYLIITNTDVSNYGLYRCFDKESRYLMQYVYYLIPITPIYESVGVGKYSEECDNEVRKDIWRLDGFHRYRFLPRLLVNSNGEKNYHGNYTFDEAKLDTNPITLVRPESADPKIVIPKFNLEIFLHWSKWTSCDKNRVEKTRTGFCHIRKTNPNQIYKESDNIFKIYTWLLPIHKLLENVDEFGESGIMLFSGVLGNLLLKDKKLPQHCTIYPRQTYDEMHKAIIDTLMEKAVNATTEEGLEIFASLCFRMVKYSNSKRLLFGHALFQNELC